MSEYLIKSKRLGDELLEIFQDPDPFNPRENDNLGKIEMYHRHYTFPHEGGFKDNPDGLIEHLNSKEVAVKLPIFAYEHGMITISTGNQYPFNDRWDAGQIGYIYATFEDIKKNWIKKRVSKKMIEQTTEILNSEIEEYDQYLRGEVYGFVLSKLVKCDHGDEHKEHLDSCWGFYSIDDILSEYPEFKDGKWED